MISVCLPYHLVVYKKCILLDFFKATAAPAPAPADAPAARAESREQKARRLRGVYDKLSLEGFSSAKIEQALSALSVRAPKHSLSTRRAMEFGRFCC